MGDMAEVFNDMKQAKKERHQNMLEQNMAILNESGVEFKVVNDGYTVLFRNPGKIKVDFYPSTGRWKACGSSKAMKGGAVAFMNWYNRQ